MKLFLKILPEKLKGTTLLRYVTLPTLLDLLANKRFSFSSPKLFKDTWEGYISTEDLRKWTNEKLSVSNPSDEEVRIWVNCVRANTFISCWSKGDKDSEVMWNRYPRENLSVALEVKTENVCLVDLDMSFISSHVPLVDEVEYKDNPSIPTPERMFFFKRESFEAEKEVRFLVCNMDNANKTYEEVMNISKTSPDVLANFDLIWKTKTFSLGCEPNNIIEKIIVNPTAQDWEVEVFKKTVKALGFLKPVNKSSLYNPPPAS